MKVKGIGVSSGVSFAKVFEIKKIKIKINNEKANIKQEQIKLDKAIKNTIDQISKIQKKAITSLSKKEVAIFDAHIKIASDPMMVEEIKKLIQNQGINAIFATNKITNNFISMFENMEDEYMKERASDIKDVAKQIIYALAGEKLVDLSLINEEVIIVAHDLVPSETAQLNKKFVKGFVTNVGGVTSHTAIMARSLEIPAVLGIKDITKKVNKKDMLLINGDSGEVIINPSKKEIDHLKKLAQKLEIEKQENWKFKGKPSQTKDGLQVKIAANISNSIDVLDAIKHDAEAIGLFRSEFLYMNAKNWPTENQQFESYKEVLEKMNNKQVVIRTLDIGGDKKLPYYNFPQEENPFLGYRAIRFCLDNQNIFKTQLRALIRASAFGQLAIMFPMIATIEEFLQAKNIFEKTYKELIEENIKVAPREDIKLGIMVEIPAVAIIAKQFAKHVDFFSIGTNDLMQYTMALDRMNEKVSYLYQPLNPSILNLIKMTIDAAHSAKKWVGMCGEMASDKNVIPLLIGMGLDEFSMSATSILSSKRWISNIDSLNARVLVEKAISLDTEIKVKQLVKKFIQNTHI